MIIATMTNIIVQRVLSTIIISPCFVLVFRLSFSFFCTLYMLHFHMWVATLFSSDALILLITQSLGLY